MKNECYEMLLKLINDQGTLEFEHYDALKKSGELYRIFCSYNIFELFKNELLYFINLLYDNSLNFRPSYRILLLNECDIIRIFRNFSYYLCLFFDGGDVHKNFPLFIYYALLKYGYNVDYVGLESRLNYFMQLSYLDDSVKVFSRISGLYTDYSKYDDKLKNNSINFDDSIEQFIWSEYSTFMYEIGLNAFSNTCDRVKWVSRFYGDGFGYDILSYDSNTKREKLIEVKSGRSSNIILTKNEFKKIYDCKKFGICDYYIYKCRYDENRQMNYYILKYDFNENCFVDIYRGDKYFISPYFEFNNKGVQEVKASIEIEEVYNKSKKIV